MGTAAVNSGVKIFLALALSVLVGACSNQNGPYLKVTGGGFIFNYRLANGMLGILIVAQRELPEGGAIEVSFTNPAGGPPLMQREELTEDQSQFDFRFESLAGIRKDTDYVVTVRLLDASGTLIDTVERVYRSDIDQAATMPEKPLTVGPGYAPNPDASH